MAPLFALREAFGQNPATVADMVRALVTLLETCHVKEKLEAYQEYFLEQQEYRLAKEYGQVYGRVEELLRRLTDLLGGGAGGPEGIHGDPGCRLWGDLGGGDSGHG